MPVSIDQYRSYILSRKFTQNPSEYIMQIYGGNAKNFTCYPDSFLLPGRNFVNTPFSYHGPEITFPLKREYNELSVNFIVYQDWYERIYFEQWMDVIFNNNTEAFSDFDFMVPSLAGSLRDITITFKDRPLGTDDGFKNNISFIFRNCYPLLITPTNCSSDNAGYTIFTINFAIKEYKVIKNSVAEPSNKL